VTPPPSPPDRLELAIAALAKARAAGNRSSTPATKQARAAAVVESQLATRKVTEWMAKGGGV
jgi:hypothetical protein